MVRQALEKKTGLGRRLAEQIEHSIFKVACPRNEALAEGSENFKEYRNQFKRLSTHLRQNDSISKRLKTGSLQPEQLASMSDQDLLPETRKEEFSQFEREALKEALGVSAEDTAHWTPSRGYTCPLCEATDCLYIQTFKGGHSYDDNNIEPAITVRCRSCRHLWKEDEVEGGRMAAGSEGSRVAADLQANSEEKPEVWKEEKGRKEPTWLLPA